MGWLKVFYPKRKDWKKQIRNKVNEYKLPGKTGKAWIKFLTSKKGKIHRMALEKNATKTLIDLHEDSIIDETNVIGLINGPPYSGKSRMARTLMKIIENKAKKAMKIKYPIEFSFYKTTLQKKLKAIKPPGGIIQDEIPREHGKDSNIKRDAVGNLTDSIRQTQISIIFCTPIKDSETFLNYKLAMFGTKKEENKLRAWMYQYIEMKPILIGIVELDFINDPKLENIYEPLKKDYLQKMKKYGGHVDTQLDKEEIESSIHKYLGILENNYNMKAVKKYIGSPRKLMSFLEQKYDLEGSENFKTQIVNGIMVRIYESELLKKEEPEILEDQEDKSQILQGKREIAIEKIELDPRIHQHEKSFLPIIKEKLWKQNIKPPKRKKIEVFNLKSDHETNLTIHRRLKIATGTVSNYFNSILLEALGYACEDAFEEILKRLGFNYVRGGLNSPDPDFIIHDLKQVISLKGYWIYRQNKALHNIAESEFKTAENLDYDLISLGFDCDRQEFHVFLVNFQSSIKKDQCPIFSQEILNTPSSLVIEGGVGEGRDPAVELGGSDGGKGGGVHDNTKKKRGRKQKRRRKKNKELDIFKQTEQDIFDELLQIK